MKNELFQELYQCFFGKVEAYIRSRVGNPHDVEDLVSQVFLKVCQNIDSFSEEKAAHSTWIYAITHNVVIDYYRKRGRDSSVELCGELPQLPERDRSLEGILREECLDTLANALENLEERERDLLLLHYYKNKSLKEIALIMGMSYSNTRIIHKKALDRMKKWMESDKKTAM